jgi:sensor histidine kinase YesM
MFCIIVISYYLKLLFTKTFYPDVILDQWGYRILFFPSLPFLIAAVIYRLIIDKIENDKRQKEIIAEQLSIKLKFLRSQISPHFIFNVLTNLVYLARKKSEQLEPALIMLSDLMRYMLYESDQKKVPLTTEIKYLESYIELQKLRFGYDVPIEVAIRHSDENIHYSIEPMLLIPFVENAFKHGIGVENPSLNIHLNVKDGRLNFKVANRFIDNDEKTDMDRNSGIGLENVRSRLLLLYPKNHTVSIKKEHNIFSVQLNLQLI